MGRFQVLLEMINIWSMFRNNVDTFLQILQCIFFNDLMKPAFSLTSL